MRDFNFFNYLIKKKKNKNLKYMNLIIIIGGFMIAMIVVYLINFGIIQKLKYDIEDREKSIDYKASEEIENTVAAKERELQILRQYDTIVTGVTAILDDNDSINSMIFSKVSSTMPQEVKFASINISGEFLSITGTASSRISIGELEHNLKEIDSISYVHIGNISFDGTSYSFDVSCIMEEEVSSEDNN
ncbi:PilN domain-containing protein [Clostridium sp. DL1XJH146]